MNENDRFPRDLAGEPDAGELRTVWTTLDRARPSGRDAGASSAAAQDRTDAAWDALSARLGLGGVAADGAEEAGRSEGGGTSDAGARPGRHGLSLVQGGERGAGAVDGASADGAPGRAASAEGAVPAHVRRAPTAEVRSGGRSNARPAAWWRAAAAVAVLLGGTAVWQAVPVTVTAPAGGQATAMLPDGSEVLLNAGSTLKHRRGFAALPGVPAASRTVTLEGEGFFDVSQDGRAFAVVAGGARVTVLGTRFNVRARGVEGGVPVVRVDVEEGRVRVTAATSGAETELGAGEGVRVVPDAPVLAPEPVAPSRIGSWRSGGLTVTDEPLTVVAAELGARFGVTVSLADGVNGSARVSAYYPSVAGLESLLADLATQQNLRVRRTADGWELF